MIGELTTEVHQTLNKLNWNLSPDEIRFQIDEMIKEILFEIQKIEAIPAEEKTFENTLQALEDLSANYGDRFASLYFPSYVSPDEAVRKASVEAVQKYRKFLIELSMRQETYEALKPLAEKTEGWDDVQKRLLERYLRDYRRMGLDLPKDKQDELKEILNELSQLSVEFQQTLNEIKDTVPFSKEDLEGVPESVLNSFKQDDNGNFIVGMSYPEVIPILEYAKNPETRKRLLEVYGNRGFKEGNVERLEKAIQLRYKAAQIRGYDMHANYVLEIRMAKTPDRVFDFLNDLESQLKPHALRDLEELKRMKSEDMGKESEIEAQDYGYYARKYLEEKYHIDKEEIKQYFPMEHTVDKMLEFYQEVFGFNFAEIENAPKWHEDVKAFAVTDKKTNKLLGVFYLDLFPREGKYNHAAAFTLIKGRYQYGQRVPTVSAMVTNFNKPTKENPSLLTHEQVNTLFHEFGHIIHQVTTQSRFYTFSGSSVARDFVEAPSQMLENWVFEPVVLNMISKHYKTGEPLPEELLKKMIGAKNALSPLRYLRQIFFGKFDMTIHTSSRCDTTTLWHELKKTVSLIPSLPGTHPQASFGHVMGGYDAGYYGYLWSEVFAQDMYTRFKKEGPTSKAVGMDYRKYILEPGNDYPEEELLQRFLGREPNKEAFLESIGLK